MSFLPNNKLFGMDIKSYVNKIIGQLSKTTSTQEVCFRERFDPDTCIKGRIITETCDGNTTIIRRETLFGENMGDAPIIDCPCNEEINCSPCREVYNCSYECFHSVLIPEGVDDIIYINGIPIGKLSDISFASKLNTVAKRFFHNFYGAVVAPYGEGTVIRIQGCAAYEVNLNVTYGNSSQQMMYNCNCACTTMFVFDVLSEENSIEIIFNGTSYFDFFEFKDTFISYLRSINVEINYDSGTIYGDIGIQPWFNYTLCGDIPNIDIQFFVNDEPGNFTSYNTCNSRACKCLWRYRIPNFFNQTYVEFIEPDFSVYPNYEHISRIQYRLMPYLLERGIQFDNISVYYDGEDLIVDICTDDARFVGDREPVRVVNIESESNIYLLPVRIGNCCEERCITITIVDYDNYAYDYLYFAVNYTGGNNFYGASTEEIEEGLTEQLTLAGFNFNNLSVSFSGSDLVINYCTSDYSAQISAIVELSVLYSYTNNCE
jgi:hypothetical protein